MTEEEIEAQVAQFSLDLHHNPNPDAITSPIPEDLTWDAVTRILDILAEEGIDRRDPKFEETINYLLNAMMAQGINLDDESEVLLFSKGITLLVLSAWTMINTEKCNDIRHVWGHVMRPTLQWGLALGYLKDRFDRPTPVST